VKAKDIMEPIKSYLSPDNTIKDAVNKMRVSDRGKEKVGVKGLIVLDSVQNMVGMVSIKDILRAIIPSYMAITDVSEFTWDGMLEEMCKKVENKKVSEIMTKEVLAIPEEAPLMEVADYIVRHNLQRIPVVNKDKKVMGMIYVRDIYYAIVKVLLDGGEGGK
jgi:predicted transcriptional regulator